MSLVQRGSPEMVSIAFAGLPQPEVVALGTALDNPRTEARKTVERATIELDTDNHAMQRIEADVFSRSRRFAFMLFMRRLLRWK